jgi:hypothetical protein
MRRPRPFLNTILGVVIAAGCSNTPSGPVQEQPQAQAGLISGLLFANCPNPPQFDVRANIGGAGGTLKMGPHTLVIPRGALSKTVEIRARTSNSGTGRGNGIEFRPEGLRFNSAVQLTISTSNCSGLGLLNLPLIVYTDDSWNILELQLSVPNLLEKKVTGFIRHFSRYAVAY